MRTTAASVSASVAASEEDGGSSSTPSFREMVPISGKVFLSLMLMLPQLLPASPFAFAFVELESAVCTKVLQFDEIFLI